MGTGQSKKLLKACVEGDAATVEDLLGATGLDRVDVNCRDPSSQSTPVMLACAGGHYRATRALLGRGDLQLALTDKLDFQAIHHATKAGSVEILKLLVDKGADVDAKIDGVVSPLGVAAFNGHISCMQLLLEKGAAVEWGGAACPLSLAAGQGHDDVVAFLEDFRKKPQKYRESADDSPTEPDATELGKLLGKLLGGLQGLPEAAQAGVNRRNGMKDSTLLMEACEQGATDQAELLLECDGVDLELVDMAGYRAIHYSSRYGHAQITRTLIDKGAEVNATEGEGLTPFSLASRHGHDAVVKVLLDTPRATVGYREPQHGWQAVHYAAKGSHINILQLLIGKGADIEAKDRNGYNPIMICALNGHTACVKYLLSRGAKVEWEGERAPLQIAKAKNKPEVVELLKDFRSNPTKYRGGMRSSASSPQLSLGGECITPPHLSVGERSSTPPPQMSVGDKFKGLFSPLRRALGQGSRSMDARLNTSGTSRATKDSGHLAHVAKAFIASRKLSDSYFDSQYDVCFCDSCREHRQDKLKYSRGVPPKDYAIPLGWCKLGLRTKPQAEAEDIFTQWHVAFHGTRVESLDKILQGGDLLLPGDTDTRGATLTIPANHWDPNNPSMLPPVGHDVTKFYFSPSIKYAGCEVYARKYRWKDPTSGESYNIRVAFQVRIKPGSYDVSDQTIGVTNQIDPLFPNSELEWSTKWRGVAILVGLLVKVETIGTGNVEDGEKTQSGSLLEEHVCWTPTGEKRTLRRGDSCLVLDVVGNECDVMHEQVEVIIRIPRSKLSLNN